MLVHTGHGQRQERAMTLRFLGIDPDTGQNGSPTIWADDITGDLIIQSHKADPDTLAECARVGSIPGHSTTVPEHETIIRLPASMLQFLAKL
jgi:hypothetical protein